MVLTLFFTVLLDSVAPFRTQIIPSLAPPKARIASFGILTLRHLGVADKSFENRLLKSTSAPVSGSMSSSTPQIFTGRRMLLASFAAFTFLTFNLSLAP